MIPGIILIIGGIFTFAGAFFNWDWFMGSGKAQSLAKLLGNEDRVQIFYEILGIIFIILGILVIFGIVPMKLF
jgi:hypothetical protein